MSHVCGETLADRESCRTSAVVLTKKKSPLHLRLFLYRDVRAIKCATSFFRASKKKCLKPSVALTVLTKHIVFPRCRSKYEMYSTYAVALLEISETLLFLSWKFIEFLRW